MTTPPASAPLPGLLRHDTLVMQQITGFMSNDFDILDGSGTQVAGRVVTTGDGLSRAFLGARSLEVVDADGTALLHVEDPVGIGFDRFSLSFPGGAPLAEVTSRFALLSTRVGMTMADGTAVEVQGDVLGLDFEFLINGAVGARATRQWAGFGRGFLGHSRYVLSIHPTLPPMLRLAAIGGSIVLDLIRSKQSRSR